ncbi:hypothetical protein AYM40_12050 [Paraburkholderia phytofirmans OLGA172]|jgi:photosystem II stability/assembly factor-like uncharacterized protein|uniref:Photosynthesis system II assembly factor Ycf48/Hcf136-like domain-containing protein n=1 Tax=Paraburkholderia phytofirmans OLGA172 TaxID=1417228 RepID=A0A160FL42_9BURK|nr:YCF48-related protein [Paraburkholderia phytofirmans]ANB73014.1 hypothetical protein AYM40_12050 [Paraburkholderia phytofirmans OLGA172]
MQMKSGLTRTMVEMAVLLTLPFAVTGAHAEPELLVRPAIHDTRASNRVMLAISRAGERLVAVGEHGIILLSDDNGKTWTQASVPVSLTLTNVRFVDATNGWAVGHGGVVLHTVDGGKNWIKQLDGVQAAALVHEAAAAAAGEGGEDARRALAAADQLVADGPDKPFLDVYFADERRGLIVGAYGLAFATEDGGKHWRSISERIPNPQGLHLYSINVSGNELFIAGEQGSLFRATGGWESFTRIATPYAGTYFGSLVANNNAIVVFGLRGNIYRSGDAGQTWQKIDGGNTTTLTAGLRLPDGRLLLVNQAGQLLQSHDAGSSFRQLTLRSASALSGITQAADGSLVLSGVRGVTSVTLATQFAEQKQ